MSKQAEYSKRNHGSSASSASSASSPSSFTTVRRHPRNPYNKHLQTPSPNPLHPHCIPKSPIVRKSPPPSPSSPSPSFSSISQNEISFDYGEEESAPAPVCPEKQTKELGTRKISFKYIDLLVRKNYAILRQKLTKNTFFVYILVRTIQRWAT